jgi:hypothetical protein
MMEQEQEEKRGRGRPRVITPEMMRFYRSMYPDIHTTRQIQAVDYAFDAMRAMNRMPTSDPRDFPPPTWLVDWAGGNAGKQGAIKWGVLEELGRMLAVGIDIAPIVKQLETQDHGRTAKEAAVILRRWRLQAGDREATE